MIDANFTRKFVFSHFESCVLAAVYTPGSIFVKFGTQLSYYMWLYYNFLFFFNFANFTR